MTTQNLHLIESEVTEKYNSVLIALFSAVDGMMNIHHYLGSHIILNAQSHIVTVISGKVNLSNHNNK